VTETRVATTADLKTIYHHEVENRLSRRLNTWMIEHLDPDGSHVLIAREPYARQAAFSLVEHYRAEVLMKYAGESDPFIAFIDVPVVDWEALRTFTELLTVRRRNEDGDTD